jgi:ubiquitin C-terminal hydrolase
MNALMQCLRSCATFVNALQVNRCHHEKALALGLMGNTGPLIKISASVYDLRYLMQHDSSELLVKILDKVRDDLSGILEGETVKTLSCPKCAVKKQWIEAFTILTLAGGGSVQDSIQNTDYVLVSGLEKCDTCKVNLVDLNVKVTKFPKVLVVQIHGSEMDRRENVSISIDQSIALQGIRYNLKSILDHHGCGDVRSGHYTARVLRGSTWWKANDNSSSECPDPTGGVTKTASLIFYEMI